MAKGTNNIIKCTVMYSDFRFKGKTYPENSMIELKEEDYLAEKDKGALVPVNEKNIQEAAPNIQDDVQDKKE